MDKQNIIVFTSSAFTEIESDQLLEKGVHSIIREPVDIDVLIETIRKMSSDVINPN